MNSQRTFSIRRCYIRGMFISQDYDNWCKNFHWYQKSFQEWCKEKEEYAAEIHREIDENWLEDTERHAYRG